MRRGKTMSRLSIADEAAALASLAPSPKQLADTAEALETVLDRIKRDGGEWFVHPSLDYLVRDRSPGDLLRAARRGMTVLRRAQGMLSAEAR
jgi:hypothetical protein